MPQPKIDFATLRERTVPLPEARARAIEAAVVRRVARHGVEAQALRAAAAVAAAAALVFLLLRLRPAPVVASVTNAPQSAAPLLSSQAAKPDWGGVVMADGSRVTFLVEGTELAQSGVAGRSPTLVHGAARFDVVHDEGVPFRVTAGNVVIEDVGTVFTVTLEEGRTRVSVESGRVSVRWAGRETSLGAGESDEFSRSAAAAEATARARSMPPTTTSPPPSAPPAPTLRPAAWTKLAKAGDYDQAYGALESAGGVVRDDPEELLLAADSARLSGHVDRAVPLLRQLGRQFPSDARAGLAAFTLGRVLLDDLDQPRDAAAAFASAYAHGGPLAEDALAREVEAWSRAGDHAAAERSAAAYLGVYPDGRRAAFVRRVAGRP